MTSDWADGGNMRKTGTVYMLNWHYSLRYYKEMDRPFLLYRNVDISFNIFTGLIVRVVVGASSYHATDPEFDCALCKVHLSFDLFRIDEMST